MKYSQIHQYIKTLSKENEINMIFKIDRFLDNLPL